MTHYFVIALVKKDQVEDAEEIISKRMQPYWEEREVRPYDHKCYCINRIAEADGYKTADKKYGDMTHLRETYRKGLDDKTIIDTDKSWRFHIQKHLDCVKEVSKKHPMFEKPDPNCEECKGSGTYKSTYNPDSKWDWYSLGGRWNGVIKKQPRNDEKGFNFNDEFRQLPENMQPVTQILKDEIVPSAILTPDGDWHEQGKMIWFGMSVNDLDQDVWKKQCFKAYETYKDHVGVGLDCHI